MSINVIQWTLNDLHEAIRNAAYYPDLNLPIRLVTPGEEITVNVSIQFSPGHYSAPSRATHIQDITHVEVALYASDSSETTPYMPLSQYVPELAEWDDNYDENGTLYSYLPIRYVLYFINAMFRKGYTWQKYK